MKVTCVVPATDAPPTLNRCMTAIRECADSPEELVCVTAPPGSGPAAARNAGAAGSDGDLLAFVDADVLVHPDAFARIRAAFGADPGLSAVFGSYDDEPEAPDAVSGFRNLLHHRVHVEGAGAAETFWAGLGAVRREAFESAGGFDAERFPHPSVEDIDLGMRLAEGGHRIRLDPAIQGKHLRRWTVAEMIRVDFARRGVPWTRLVLEAGRGSDALNLAARHRAGMAASVVAAAGLAGGRPRVALAGAAALVGLNAPLYSLIWRRRGPGQAAAAVGLHLIHHLTGAVAAAGGLAGHLVAPRRTGSTPRP
jgi:hypothetical protein